ncbi:Maltose/maltodextrin ABC transporter, permease protein MalG [[Actinomadura] parvosata subsp. kistnae]|uniref:ABC transporter permease n=1 Tax=[Actinomadura] parvosata subsp. kistnae TaxID=1909395 RepID=A0A1V0A080_9ACTN|nr:carbohydrate ABC transporter permease [Nonomuraea sp. ATCC 55076]AQZ63608.1 ABC transporter permease [Nonomuraea sp. ATCC 55076]SPL99384.1 Maltose/maltodextrin ABC transporter, permease protein MalG [Actinomadura parvosata subsp. kistnae]
MTATLSRSVPLARAPRRRRPRSRAAVWAAVAVIGFFGLAPIYWLVVTAFTPDERAFTFPPSLVPAEITFDHFTKLAENEQLFGYLVNSVVVSVVTALLSVVVSAYMAYAFSKFRYRGRKSLMHLVLASQLFPQALLLVTLYAVFSATGLLGSYAALILSFTTFTLPLCVWMLKGIFDTVPSTLMEAAAIDGASRWRTLHRIALPLAAPGLVAAGLFAFVRAWNDFIFALTLTDPDRQTLPPGLVHTYLGEFQTAWPDLMAASFVVSLPVIAAFMFLQRYLVGGLTAGAVKG